jgi:four helix bundle protein
MQGHKELIVWQKAMDLVVAIYKITQSFPKTEVYGLASQMPRAAVSVPSNIAEGRGLKQTQAYARHLAIANGSFTELETQLEIARRLGYLSAENKSVVNQAGEVGRMLAGLRRSLQSRLESPESRILNPVFRGDFRPAGASNLLPCYTLGSEGLVGSRLKELSR